MTKSQGELVEADNVVDELELQDSGSGAAQKEKVVAEAKTGDQLEGIVENAKENVVAEAKTGDQLEGIVENAKENVTTGAAARSVDDEESDKEDEGGVFMSPGILMEKEISKAMIRKTIDIGAAMNVFIDENMITVKNYNNIDEVIVLKLYQRKSGRRSIVRDSWVKFMRLFHVEEKTALTIFEGDQKNHFLATVANNQAAAPAIENNATIENNPAAAAAIENNPAASPNI